MIRMPKYKYYFAISDLIVVSISFIVSSYILARNTSLEFFKSGNAVHTLLLLLVLSGTVIYLFDRNNLYKINIILKRTVHMTALIKSLVFASLITFIVFIFFYRDSVSALSMVSLVFAFSASLLFYMMRIEVYRRMILRKRNFFKRNLLVIGTGESGKKIAQGLVAENPYGINIVGFLDDGSKPGIEIINGKSILGKVNDLRNIAAKYFLDEVVIALDGVSHENLLHLLEIFKGLNLRVKLFSPYLVAVKERFSKEKYGGVAVIDVTPTKNLDLRLRVKRWIDIIGSLFGLILLSPFLLLIIVLIKIGSPGPIFFRQTRIGLNGKPFDFYKFRSMHVMNGEDEERKKMMLDFMKNNVVQDKDKKIINDKRVTWIGKFIRRTSLDELPQLFNVLVGDMSLVGPRPCLPYEYENYDTWQKKRVMVVPGCTGVWQVSGRSSVSFNDSVLMDLYYINNMSLLFDMRILLKTFPVMFLSKGGK
jgi:exopolysaccharide biosynthesis polyprenyl glycosylphosphotransferase